MIKAVVLVLIVARLEALAVFLWRALSDPAGTRYQIFLDYDAWWTGVALGWVFGIISIGALVAYADRIYLGQTSLKCGCDICLRREARRGGIQADRHRFW